MVFIFLLYRSKAKTGAVRLIDRQNEKGRKHSHRIEIFWRGKGHALPLLNGLESKDEYI
jgi:hypothetical protein